jgi:hypothetical protein
VKPSHEQDRRPAPRGPHARPPGRGPGAAGAGCNGHAPTKAEAPAGDGAARAVCCDVAAHAVVRVPVETLAEFRRQPGPVSGPALPPAFLKHADEQTVAGMTAVYQAIHDHGLAGTGFNDWGVLGSPHFLGRPALAAALQRFGAEGAWGVSPHLIPQRCLHALSGTVSQALKVHGPNFGVGGGPGGTAEVLLAATSMLHCRRLPGVWAVLTSLYPEVPPDPEGRPPAGSLCVGLALALVPARPGWPGVRMRVVAGCAPECPALAGGLTPRRSPACVNAPPTQPVFDLFRLERLLGCVGTASPGETAVVQVLDAGSRIELSKTAALNGQATGNHRQDGAHVLSNGLCHGCVSRGGGSPTADTAVAQASLTAQETEA